MVTMKQYRVATYGIIILIIALLGFAVFQSTFFNDVFRNPFRQAAVEKLVTEFGEQLQKVPLTAEDPEITRQAIRDNYSAYVTPELLEQWLADPEHAPGRLTSSPWPDRIAVSTFTEQGSGYVVEGSVIYVTSVEVENGGAADETAVLIQVISRDGEWLIAAYQEQQFEEPDPTQEG